MELQITYDGTQALQQFMYGTHISISRANINFISLLERCPIVRLKNSFTKAMSL